MAEEAIKKKLNHAKRSACKLLSSAGYKTERASNDIYCVVAMRDTEWRAIKIGIKSITACPWFIQEVRKLERLPCPNPKTIKKEVWLRSDGEHLFYQYHWDGSQWIDEDGEPTNLLN